MNLPHDTRIFAAGAVVCLLSIAATAIVLNTFRPHHAPKDATAPPTSLADATARAEAAAAKAEAFHDRLKSMVDIYELSTRDRKALETRLAETTNALREGERLRDQTTKVGIRWLVRAEMHGDPEAAKAVAEIQQSDAQSSATLAGIRAAEAKVNPQ